MKYFLTFFNFYGIIYIENKKRNKILGVDKMKIDYKVALKQLGHLIDCFIEEEQGAQFGITKNKGEIYLCEILDCKDCFRNINKIGQYCPCKTWVEVFNELED